LDLSAYMLMLMPEWILLGGGCVVMLVGLVRDGRSAGPLAAGVMLAGLIATRFATHNVDQQPPGLIISDLLDYVRIGGLSVGVLAVLAAMHLPAANERGEFFAMILFSFCGLLLTAAANDIVVLFFAIELVSVPTYVLVSLSRRDQRASEAGVKYFFLGALAAAIMVYGFSFLYGAMGGTTTLTGPESMASYWDQTSPINTYATVGLVLVLAGIFFKIAAVPFHVYAPDVYEGAASPITGLLGFLPKFAGFVAAIKILTIFDWRYPGSVFWLIWIVAALTMTVGNTVALLQSNVKRVLAYSSISHSGYMLIALLVGPMAGQGPLRDGVAALLFYMVIYGVMNLGAFAVLSALESESQPAEKYSDMEGLSRSRPGLALGLAVCCFSLMGFPPTAGMLGKVYVFSSAFSLGADHPYHQAMIVLAIIGVLNSAIAAAYYLKIVATCYVKPQQREWLPVGGGALGVAVGVCALAMILGFIQPRGLTDRAKQASPVIANANQTSPDDSVAVADHSSQLP